MHLLIRGSSTLFNWGEVFCEGSMCAWLCRGLVRGVGWGCGIWFKEKYSQLSFCITHDGSISIENRYLVRAAFAPGILEVWCWAGLGLWEGAVYTAGHTLSAQPPVAM